LLTHDRALARTIAAEPSGTLVPRPQHPVQRFGVDDLGVRFPGLHAAVAPSFRDLPWDAYDARRERIAFLAQRFPDHAAALHAALPAYYTGALELAGLDVPLDALDAADRAALHRIRPYRRRAVATFLLTKTYDTRGRWRIAREPDEAFVQAPDREGDVRSLPRRFAPSPPEVVEARPYRALLRGVARMADAARGGRVTALRIVCHQMGLVARSEGGVSNAPEGIHQDGADYIVSALVIERRNVEGGESVVYGADRKTEILRHTLGEGEGIFQADAGSPLWHAATPIHPIDARQEAVRNILGYDVHVL